MLKLGLLLFLSCSSIFHGILARSPHANPLAISLSRMKRFKELPDISGTNNNLKEQMDQEQARELLILPQDGRALFRAFLQKEYAEENLDFVLKVDIYRTCSPRKRAKMAWKLYRTFIAIGAPHELNLDILSRKVTDLAMITPHVSTFDTAQKRILNLLENDAYRRFLMWNVYLDLVHTYDVHQNPDEDDETRL
ncbi:hypothetical protein TCAL_05916 [Tigriopus californicus]|uniref:RGS domain-containing protein n=1 Tax=Tigriopus californicus TaxID=6832 RepID=A0A553PN19_TIGCA|nr:hypothetical protein TCAL_05916 [Tigriopus californicus]